LASQPKAKKRLENCSGQGAENNTGRPTWDQEKGDKMLLSSIVFNKYNQTYQTEDNVGLECDTN